jgi:hypothetical protein
MMLKKSTKIGSLIGGAAVLAGVLLGGAPASAAGNHWNFFDRSYQTCIIQTAKKASALSGAGYVITKVRICQKQNNPQSGTWYISDLYY